MWETMAGGGRRRGLPRNMSSDRRNGPRKYTPGFISLAEEEIRKEIALDGAVEKYEGEQQGSLKLTKKERSG